ncbi:MAG: hypothetical protein IPN59_11370 [Holophaga sp.]|nr:hypothetical protein [Holophaga sp.]
MPFAWTYIPISGRTQKFEINERSGFRIISAQNLAAIEMPPFSLPVSLDRPVLSMFFQPKQTSRAAKESEKEFWDLVGKAIRKDDFESEINKGPSYEVLRSKLFHGISSLDPLVFAGKLLSALEKEIINVSHFTHEESAKWAKDLKTPKSRDLEAISEKKVATGRGMTVLLYHLLKDAGSLPKVAYLADRDVRLFRPAMTNPWQASHPVIAMETPNKGIVILDPWQRFAAPGLIHPDFQGVQGILFDPKADWAGQPFTVPIQPAAFNQRRFDYALEVGEEENHFKLKAQFSGFPELAERRRYDQDEQIERNRKLKERFENQVKGASIQKSEVLNANNPTANVTWAVEGQVETEGGRQRQVFPFPGLQYPVNIPGSFPKERILPIVMPYLQIQTARCSFKIPKGYKVNPGNPFKESNTFGTVLWSTQIENQGDDQVAVITLKVSVDTMFAAPAAYDELKTFLGWVSEAFKRTLILEKT